MKSAKTLLLLAVFSGAAMAQSGHEAALKNMKFRSIGPAVMGGRVDDFAVVESDPRIIYVGPPPAASSEPSTAASPGPIFDDAGTRRSAISPWRLQSRHPLRGHRRAEQPPELFVGQRRLQIDGRRQDLEAPGLKETHHIGRIVVHPTNPNIVYVAALGGLWGPNTDRGVFKTTDGGATWTQDAKSTRIPASDIAIDPAKPQHPLRRRLQAPPHGLWLQRRRSQGRHLPFHRRRRALDQASRRTARTTGDIGRCAVDISRKNPNIVYALSSST